jgi:lipid-A-disaccharide synthase
LVNVVAGRQVAQEFIQDDIVPVNMAAAVDELIDAESPRRKQVLAGLAEVRSKLGTAGAADRVARIVSDLLT